jgi:hypothetical protein
MTTRMRGVVPQSKMAMGGTGSHGLSLWHWGPDDQRNRLVKVAVLRDDDGNAFARTFGVDGPEFVVLEDRADVTTWRWNPAGSGGSGFVEFADGTRWELSRGGCGCGHPLKRLHPTRSKIKEI